MTTKTAFLLGLLIGWLATPPLWGFIRLAAHATKWAWLDARKYKRPVKAFFRLWRETFSDAANGWHREG